MAAFVLRIAVLTAIAAMLSLPRAGSSDAADYRVTPSLRLGQGWDSNIFNTTANEVSDFYFTAAPELILSAATRNLSLQLTGRLEGRWYYQNPDISTWDYSEYLSLSSTEGWRITDRFAVTPAAYFLKTSDQYQRALLVPADPALPAPGIATVGLQDVNNFGASIGLRYLATPTVETSGTVFVASQRYPGPSSGASDSGTLGADAVVRYLFSPRSSVGGYVAASAADYETTPDSRVLSVGLLGGHRISTTFTLDLRLGMAFARQSASAAGAPEQTTQSPAGTISLGYTDNTFRANLYANAGYSGLGGAGELTRQGTAGFSVNDHLTERWSWSLGGYYQLRRTVFAADTTDLNTAVGNLSILYAPWEWGAFDLTGSATRQWSDIPGGDLVRYSAVFGFTLRNTYTGN